MREITEISITFRGDDGVSDTFTLKDVKFHMNNGGLNEIQPNVLATKPPNVSLEISGSLVHFQREFRAKDSSAPPPEPTTSPSEP
jgi:hypothetical protein